MLDEWGLVGYGFTCGRRALGRKDSALTSGVLWGAAETVYLPTLIPSADLECVKSSDWYIVLG